MFFQLNFDQVPNRLKSTFGKEVQGVHAFEAAFVKINMQNLWKILVQKWKLAKRGKIAIL